MTIVVLTFLQTVMRQLNLPLTFGGDLNMLLFGWTAFLGADVAFRHSRLVGMNILTSKLNKKAQKIVAIVVYIIIIVTLVVFIKYGFDLAISDWDRTYNALQISYGWATLSLPVCSIFMIITASVKIYETALHFKDDNFSLKDKKEKQDAEGKAKELNAENLK